MVKASNPLVMVQAYRLLAAEMYKLGWDYPLHLGLLVNDKANAFIALN
jgi:(E)-4-hydroxy-3-methylbut-2-enyl-diphosphate synthase